MPIFVCIYQLWPPSTTDTTIFNGFGKTTIEILANARCWEHELSDHAGFVVDWCHSVPLCEFCYFLCVECGVAVRVMTFLFSRNSAMEFVQSALSIVRSCVGGCSTSIPSSILWVGRFQGAERFSELANFPA
jgi:hypothetical protein